MKKLLYLSPLFLVGCAATKWLVDNQESIEQGSDAAGGFGPYGAIAGLIGTSAVGFAKWYEHKSSARDVIASVQQAKDELPEESKKLLRDGLHKYTPSKIKKYIGKVKKGL